MPFKHMKEIFRKREVLNFMDSAFPLLYSAIHCYMPQTGGTRREMRWSGNHLQRIRLASCNVKPFIPETETEKKKSLWGLSTFNLRTLIGTVTKIDWKEEEFSGKRREKIHKLWWQRTIIHREHWREYNRVTAIPNSAGRDSLWKEWET